jgi:hypothetical protein
VRSHTAFLAAAAILAAVSPAWAWTVPGTGITACYDNVQEIVCPSPGQAFYGQNGNFPGTPRSYAQTADTVTDQVTGLVWQKTPDGVARTHSAAATYCADLDLGGQTDWRLPDQRELATIIDHSLNKPAFAAPLEGSTGEYWSGAPYLGYADAAWYVHFGYGVSEFNGAAEAKYVRCARGAALAGPSYTVSGEVVSDAATGRMWERTGSVSAMNWQAALAYCQSSSTGGYTDWRLPDVMELRTLADYALYDPAVDVTALVSVGFDTWTSSAVDTYPGLAWHVNFQSGFSAGEDKTASLYARCVRIPSSSTQDPAAQLLLLLQEQ